MQAQLLHRIASLAEIPEPLSLEDVPVPEPGPGQVLLEVAACGVCHTELDEIEGRTPPPHLPVIPGHQVIGTLAQRGPGSEKHLTGARLGVAWIYDACGECAHCLRGEENLCPEFRATGRDAHGGYAQYILVHQDFAVPVPAAFSDAEAAPLLCAGAVGYRSLRLAAVEDGMSLGFSGFGASAHLVLQLAMHLYPNSQLYVLSRSAAERTFALQLGAHWAGSFDDAPPVLLDRIIDTTPAWLPVLVALQRLAPGGRLVINAIRKEDTDRPLLASLNYADQLWHEKEMKSTANVTRRDVSEFLELAARLEIHPEVQEFSLSEANIALQQLKARQIRGAKVLKLK